MQTARTRPQLSGRPQRVVAVKTNALFGRKAASTATLERPASKKAAAADKKQPKKKEER